MKALKEYITKHQISEKIVSEKLTITKDSKINGYNYCPKTKKELTKLLDKLIKERGNEADLNDIDVSNINNMEQLFINSEFNGDISKWDVSNVTDMTWMFHGAEFNGNISDWDVSHVEFMDNMFQYSEFNQNIDNWKVSNETSMIDMFDNCPLEKNPPKWYK